MTLEIFKKCESKYDWFAYIRFGLYFVMRDSSRKNFCDVHLGWLPTEKIDRGIYSGPKDKVNEITRYNRSDEAVTRYENKQQVHSDLDITAGGAAKIVYSKDHKATDIWLFGPLLLNKVPFGSLVAELEGFVTPKTQYKETPIDEKTGAKRKSGDPKARRYLAIFPRDYGQRYHPCKLWGSSYAEGMQPRAPRDENIDWDHATGTEFHWKDNRAPGEPGHTPPPRAPDLVDALTKARASLQAVSLPDGATRVEWKIEDYSSELTECQLYDRGG